MICFKRAAANGKVSCMSGCGSSDRIAVRGVALAVAIYLTAHSPVLADGGDGQDQVAGSTPSAPQAAPADSEALGLEQKRALEGHIKDEALSLETGIRDLVKTLHHLKRAAFDVFIEVQRQDMAVVAEPDVIGPIIIPAIPSPTGMVALGGFLPPRKKFLDYFMDQIGDLVKMTQTEVSGLALTDDADPDTKAEMKSINDQMTAIPKDVATLSELTQGPNFDNNSIAKQAQIIQERVVLIEKACKKINASAKKQESKIKKDLKDLDRAIKKESQGK